MTLQLELDASRKSVTQNVSSLQEELKTALSRNDFESVSIVMDKCKAGDNINHSIVSACRQLVQSDIISRFERLTNELSKSPRINGKSLRQVLCLMKRVDQHISDHQAFEDFLLKIAVRVDDFFKILRTILVSSHNQVYSPDALVTAFESLISDMAVHQDLTANSNDVFKNVFPFTFEDDCKLLFRDLAVHFKQIKRNINDALNSRDGTFKFDTKKIQSVLAILQQKKFFH